jgi:lipid-A-disaccharide synthase
MESPNPLKIYVIAGEVSGDLHGKNLLAGFHQQREGIRFRGVGGDGLAGQGMEIVQHIRETSFMGFTQVLANLGKIRKLFKLVKADVKAWKPDAVVLIDYPGFNLRIAKWFKRQGIQVFFYISPTVWAWKKSRIGKIRVRVDRLFAILPFEQPFYAKEGYEVEFLGHPLLDELALYKSHREETRRKLLDPDERLVALLPGSRKQEITRMLPKMLAIKNRFPRCRFVVAAAPNLDAELYAELIGNEDVQVLKGHTYDILSAADAALVTSGTATLETALFGVPQVVCYAANALSIRIARWLIHVRFISLVNLILHREAVRELIQKDLHPEALAAELRRLLDDPKRKQQVVADYAELRSLLGAPGASGRVAAKMLELIAERQS